MSDLVKLDDIHKMATAVANSGLFGVKTVDQAMALMLISQAEGRHPMLAAQEYHIIQGRPALRAESMLARFQAAGGCVEWIESNDDCAVGVFSHPQGKSLKVRWDEERAIKAQLFKVEGGKRLQNTRNGWQVGNYEKFGAAMFRARCIAEGVRAVFPSCVGSMYSPEEIQDFDKKEEVVKETKVEVIEEAEVMATREEVERFETWVKELEKICVEKDLIIFEIDAEILYLLDEKKDIGIVRLKEESYKVKRYYQSIGVIENADS